MKDGMIYKAKVSNMDLIFNGVLVFFLVGWFTIWGAIKRRNSYLEVYSNEVIAKQGIASKKSVSYPISSIQSIGVEQSLIGKMLNFGTITISTAGIGYISMKAIENPEEVKRIIYELKSK